MPHVWQMPWNEDEGRWWFRVFFDVTFLEEDYKVADLSPLDFRKQSATDTTKLDPNIGFQGLALIQGQIYNPGSIWLRFICFERLINWCQFTNFSPQILLSVSNW